jgi:hypothetical protein
VKPRTLKCSCGTCKTCVHREYMRAERERNRFIPPAQTPRPYIEYMRAGKPVLTAKLLSPSLRESGT